LHNIGLELVTVLSKYKAEPGASRAMVDAHALGRRTEACVPKIVSSRYLFLACDY